MIPRKLALRLALLLLLTSVELVAAQSSSSYLTPRFITASGGTATSASYAVVSVIGQPLTNLVESPTYKVSGGFLHAQQQKPQGGHQLWLPIIQR